MWGQIEAIRVLAKAGANTKLATKPTPPYPNGETAMMMAQRYGKGESVAAIEQIGIPAHAWPQQHTSLITHAQSKSGRRLRRLHARLQRPRRWPSRQRRQSGANDALCHAIVLCEVCDVRFSATANPMHTPAQPWSSSACTRSPRWPTRSRLRCTGPPFPSSSISVRRVCLLCLMLPRFHVI